MTTNGTLTGFIQNADNKHQRQLNKKAQVHVLTFLNQLWAEKSSLLQNHAAAKNGSVVITRKLSCWYVSHQNMKLTKL